MLNRADEPETDSVATSASDRIACVSVTRPDTHFGLECIYELTKFSAVDEMDGAEEGDSIVLTLVMMTRQEITDLPDFEGW